MCLFRASRGTKSSEAARDTRQLLKGCRSVAQQHVPLLLLVVRKRGRWPREMDVGQRCAKVNGVQQLLACPNTPHSTSIRLPEAPLPKESACLGRRTYSPTTMPSSADCP